jgi:hypothetical protein
MSGGSSIGSCRPITGCPARSAPGRWPAALIFAVTLVLYLRTLCPTVFVEGTGENVVCVWTLGVPHPPGFPLFCLLGKLFCLLLPIDGAAYRVNLFAAVMGAVAAAGLYLVLVAGGAGRLASAAAALAFAFSATMWRQSTIAEVYTLSLAIILLQFGLLLRWRRSVDACVDGTPNDRALLWAALLFGLGLTVHYYQLLLLPAYAYFILAHDRGVLGRWRTWSAGLALAALGFGLHVYTPARSLADPPIDWGNPESLRNLLAYLGAEQYRGHAFQMPLSQVAANLRASLYDLPGEFGWPALLAGLVGLAALLRRDRRLLWTTALMAAAVVFWAINYDIPWEIRVYYLPALLAVALWIGFGLHAVVEWLARRRRLRWLCLLLLAVPAAALALNFRQNDLSRQRFVVDNALDIIHVVEPKSVILLPSTNPTYALLYLTWVEGRAPEISLWSRVQGGLTPVERAVHPAREAPPVPETRLVSEWTGEGLPVYTVDREPAGALAGFVQIPWGCLYRLAPARDRAALMARAPDALSWDQRFDVAHQRFEYGEEQKLLACRYLLVPGDYAWERGDLALADRFHERALGLGGGLPSISAQVGQRYVEQGRAELAVRVYRDALARKDDSLIRNRLGAIYGRRGQLDEAAEQFQHAIYLRPDYAEAHANLASVYGRRGELDKAVSELELALRHDPNSLLALRNLAFAYVQLGRPYDARLLLKRALAINPADANVEELLRRLEAAD